MLSIVVVDSGPLVAAANRADPDHQACLEILRDPGYRLVIPALCVAEVSYFLGSRQGPEFEARFLRGLEQFDVRAPEAAEWPRIAELVTQYADLPLGGTDASVISLAESLDTDLVLTLDRRHFTVVKPRHRRRLKVLP
jgi:predicted nucleic acid-binding protein